MPATLHDASGFTALPPKLASAPLVIDAPFISQIAVSPVPLLRQRMSRRSSPLKSPIPATLHEVSGLIATPPMFGLALDWMFAPFMNQVASVPSELRQRTSLRV